MGRLFDDRGLLAGAVVLLCAGMLLAPGLALAEEASETATLTAVPCDHRFGASATWTESSDGLRTPMAFLPELLGFKFGLGLTVFESPDTTGRVAFEQRRKAYATGRLKPSLYYHESADPKAGLTAQIAWFKKAFGQEPTALSYRQGRDAATSGFTPSFVYGARNSRFDFRTSYGRSSETSGAFLGQPATDFGAEYLASLTSTTRFYDQVTWQTMPDGSPNPDFGAPLSTSIASAEDALESAIATRGWYSDFTHWSSPPGPVLYSFFSSQSAVIASATASGESIARVPFGDAVAHRALRDAALCALLPVDADAMELRVLVRDDATLPAASANIPLSVRLRLADTPLAGREIRVFGARGLRKTGADEFVVEVPWSPLGTMLRVEAVDSPSYTASTPPRIDVALSGESVVVTTDRPTHVAAFVSSARLDYATAADAAWRSSRASSRHVFRLRPSSTGPGSGVTMFDLRRGRLALYVGAIDAAGQSSVRRIATSSRRTFARTWQSRRTAPLNGLVEFRARLVDRATCPLPGRRVVLERRIGGRWSYVTTALRVRSAPGVYVAHARATRVGANAFRLRALGDSAYSGCSSSGLTVTVRSLRPNLMR